MPRPPAYDRDTVIDLALDQFWAKGFGKSDVEQLTRAAGVNRHSLYNVFGGKSGLFKHALSRYIDATAVTFLAVLQSGSGLEAIRAYFEKVAEAFSTQRETDTEQRGCMITNTVIELSRKDEEVSKIIDRYYAKVEKAFCQTLIRGQEDGSIRPDFNPKAMAKWLVFTNQGISVSARMNRITADLADSICALLSNPQR